METLRNFGRTMGPVRLAVLAATALLLAGFFAWIVSRASAAPQALLFGDLDTADAARVVAQLDTTGVPYTLGNGGTAIFVASDQVARTRLALAEQGLPAGGSIGYEIFDSGDMLGASTFQQNINLVRALEGELARTIRSIETVKAARVHLVLPHREVFSRDKAEASASVLLQMRGRARLTPAQVAAVQQLVAAAVPGLTPARISIIDGQGTLLSEGQDSGDPVVGMGAKADQRRREVESRLSRTVEELMERIVGPGKVRAEVSAEMDFDRVNTSEEIFDPDGQVVRSTQTVEQNTSSHDGSGAAPVSVATNLPDAAPETSSQGSSPSNSASTDTRNEETVNYEISKKVINHVRESGVVKRLSVAVLVDGTMVTAEDGTHTYQPRSAEELQQLTNLVQGAVGFDAQRGDKVEVVSMRFAEPDLPPEIDTAVLLGLEKSELIRIGTYFAIFVLAVLVLLLVIRPIVARAVQAIPVAPAGAAALPGAAGQPVLLPGQTHPAQLTGPNGGATGVDIGDARSGIEPKLEEMIDIQRVEGRVRASSLKRVSEIVEKHPEESLAIVRNWLHDQN